MGAPLKLCFGVEFEVMTDCRIAWPMEWHEIAGLLGNELTAVGVQNHVHLSQRYTSSSEDCKKWSVAREVVIRNQMMQDRC